MENGKVFETINFSPEGKFHPSLIWEAVPDDVEQNYIKVSDKEFKAPEKPIDVPIESEPKVQCTKRPVLSIIEFKMCFTSAERVAIYALKDSGDAFTTDWLSILDDPRSKNVDLSLVGVQDAVNYFIGKIKGFDDVRAEEVLSGHLI